MNWNKINALTNVLISLTLIVSLIYAANQIKQQVNAQQIATSISTSEKWVEHQMLLATDKELNTIFWRGLESPDRLTLAEQRRLEAFLAAWIQTFQQSYLLNESGTMHPGLWHNQRNSMRWIFSASITNKIWDEWKHNFVPSFVMFVDTNILTETATAPNNSKISHSQ